MLTERLEKKMDGNSTRMLRAILNRSWRQHPTRHQLYGHLSPITKTIQVRRTRHAGLCWRSRDELICDVLLGTPTYGQAKAGQPARTYIQQLCEDTGCSPEDLPEAMNDKEKWRERVRDIRANGTTLLLLLLLLSSSLSYYCSSSIILFLLYFQKDKTEYIFVSTSFPLRHGILTRDNQNAKEISACMHSRPNFFFLDKHHDLPHICRCCKKKK